MNKTLVIIRHAHRDTSHGRDLDNGLDDKGKKQSRKILKYFKERFGKQVPQIYSSRLERCMETVEPIASESKVEVEISPLLVERWIDKANETEKEFQGRIEEFCDEWKKSKATLTVACSHGDWIPEALKYLVATQSELKKGGWAEIEMIDGKPTLSFLIQKFI